MTKEAIQQDVGMKINTYMGLMKQNGLREISIGPEDIVEPVNRLLTSRGVLDFIAERRLAEKTKYLMDCTVLVHKQPNNP